MKRFDERGVFYGQGSDDGLHHGVPLLPPDDAGPAAVGERTGTLAVSLLPRECRVLAISLAPAAQRAGGGPAALALVGAARPRGARRAGVSALRAGAGQPLGQVLPHQQCAPAHAHDARGNARWLEIVSVFHRSRDAGPRGGYSCLQRIMHKGCIGELRSTAAGRSAS